MKPMFAAAVCALILCGCARSADAASSPSPGAAMHRVASAAASAGPVAAPAVEATSGAAVAIASAPPTASPTANATATPTAAPTPGSASGETTRSSGAARDPLVVRGPDEPPQILSFAISANVVHPGDVLSGVVTASSNVASVEVRVAGYSYVMQKVAPGQFRLSATIPSVPKMFRRTYPLVAIARNTRGDATQRETQITIR